MLRPYFCQPLEESYRAKLAREKLACQLYVMFMMIISTETAIIKINVFPMSGMPSLLSTIGGNMPLQENGYSGEVIP